LPIGIDLGTSAVKIAQLRHSPACLELMGLAKIDVPELCRDDLGKRMEFMAGALGGIIRTAGFAGRECILSLPAALTFVQHVKTAKVSGAELTQALRWELEGKLPFSSDEAVIRHVVAGDASAEREDNQEVIVLAASRQSIGAHLAMAQRAHLEVVGLNVEPCAILECFGRLLRRSEDARRVSLFLDIGQCSTQVVVSHGARLAFAKNLTFGARQLDESVAAALAVPLDQARGLRLQAADDPEHAADLDGTYQAMGGALEAAVTEITKCLRYYESVFPSNPVERAIFLGGQAMDRRLCQAIAQQLSLPAQVGDPLGRIGMAATAKSDGGVDRHKAQPAWTVAVGLSLGAQTPAAA
jgi:type IV pilus assembly protein PilM